jgi:HrpA-like RNA helicase
MNTKLPIFQFKNVIVNAVNENPVTIVTAETGSGKSTQVCQYLYEEGYDVVVTEPRRLAAVSLAKRVKYEMNADNGTVAYKTAFESTETQDTRILFCTDGLQLVRSLTRSRKSARPQVLILDEVHEWNLNQETLVAWVKLCLNEGWDTKVVIMSATLECDELQSFFNGSTPIIRASGSLFPVSYEHRYDYKFVDSIVELVREGKNVLAFVAGKKEIADTIEELTEERITAVILPLHGELTIEEQQKCFDSYSQPKVIVSTNVAQTSVTVPDIDAVVDLGNERRVECHDGIQGIFLNDISQADCIQRKGRAGRTKEGTYILCSDKGLEKRVEFSTPEIQRSILDQVVLRLSAVGIDSRKLEFFHQPGDNQLALAHEVLENLGALEDNEITELGKKMARLPLSARNSRMLCAAEEYGVVDEIITISAILEVGSLLAHVSQACYSDFTNERGSDLLAELDVWEVIKTGNFRFAKDFRDKNLSIKSYKRIEELREKLEFTVSQTMELGSTGDREAIKKVCVLGMMDSLYFKSGWEEYTDGKGEFKLDRKSVCSNSRWIVGIPHTIEFQDKRWSGMTRKMTIINQATAVDIESLMEQSPHLVESGWDTSAYNTPTYNPADDEILGKYVVKFKGIVIKSDYISSKEHPQYEELKQEYLERKQNQENYWREKHREDEERRKLAEFKRQQEIASRQKEIVVGGKTYTVHWDGYYQPHPFISVTVEELLHIEETSLKLDNGREVEIHCNSEVRNNFVTLKEVIKSKMLSGARKGILPSHYPKQRIARREDLHVLLPHVGKTLVWKDTTEEIYSHIHLAPVEGVICLAITTDEVMAETGNRNALQALIMRVVKERYNEKKFMLKLKGKWVWSKTREKAKADFDAFVEDALESISIETVEDTFDYLEEAFAECVKDLSEAS